jgi:hypothetical protein
MVATLHQGLQAAAHMYDVVFNTCKVSNTSCLLQGSSAALHQGLQAAATHTVNTNFDKLVLAAKRTQALLLAQVEGVAPRGTGPWSHTLSPALTYPGAAERPG